MGVKKVWSEDNHCDMWQADYRIKVSNKLKRIRKLYFTKEAAEKAVRTDKVAAENGTYQIATRHSLIEWKEKVMRYVNAQRNGSTPKSYEHILEEFITVMGKQNRIESLDRRDMLKYVEYLRNQGLSNSTVRSYYNRVVSALNMAPQLIDSLISWHPPTIRFELTSKPRERVLEPEEIAKLKAALLSLDQDHYDIVVCALNTGGRLREILSLTWDRVLWNVGKYRHGALKLKVTKTKGNPLTYRSIPMTNELASILKRRQTHVSSPFVFPSTNRKNKHRNYMDVPLKEACKKAGIIYGRDVENGFVFHDLRRTAVTYLRGAGVEIEEVIAITGHSASVMLHTYSKTNEIRLQAAIDKLGLALSVGQLKAEVDENK